MDGYPSKLAGELHTFTYGNTTQHFASAGVSTPVQPMTSTPPYITQQTHTSSQLEGKTSTTAPGTSLQDDFNEGAVVGGGGGRKKKKKQKSGDDSGTSVKAEDDLVDATIPLLSENQGVEDLFPASLPPPGGTVVGGQYLLNNSLLDQILTEKKMQILQSPDVTEFLKKQMSKK